MKTSQFFRELRFATLMYLGLAALFLTVDPTFGQSSFSRPKPPPDDAADELEAADGGTWDNGNEADAELNSRLVRPRVDVVSPPSEAVRPPVGSIRPPGPVVPEINTVRPPVQPPSPPVMPNVKR